jgi:hypothetical protein
VLLASGWLAVFVLGGERIEALHYERGDGASVGFYLWSDEWSLEMSRSGFPGTAG